MILKDVQPPEDRAVLVGAPTKDIPADIADEHLSELAELADTAGARVVERVRQKLDQPNPKFYIGEGKAEELKSAVQTNGANLIIFDEELTPKQGKNLEDYVGTRVVDRAELILDIFATRARSAEAQMQVELAQLEYMLPRLRRMWTHLSRIRGGIGLRGPGETQLETDRRLISRRIRDLREKLAGVSLRRATQRKGRNRELRAALVGYTNAGKSSIMRALTGADVLVEDRLFATLDPSTKVVDMGSGSRVLLTDTVGFIRKLPHHLVASFRATLEEATHADLLLHVVDASHKSMDEHMEVVDDVLRDLDVDPARAILVFNKMDLLTHNEEEAFRQRARGIYQQRSVFTSAMEDKGMAELRTLLSEELRALRPEVHVVIPAADGETLASVYREGEVVRRDDVDGNIELIARLPVPLLGKLRGRDGVTVFIEDGAAD